MAKMPHHCPDNIFVSQLVISIEEMFKEKVNKLAAIIKQFLCECKLNSVKEVPVKVTTSSIFVFFK